MSFTILGPIAEAGAKLPMCSFQVPAGFPSPAADHIEQHISLDEVLNIRAPHVYLVAITGESMRRNIMSQSYTTKLDQLWSVACK